MSAFCKKYNLTWRESNEDLNEVENLEKSFKNAWFSPR